MDLGLKVFISWPSRSATWSDDEATQDGVAEQLLYHPLNNQHAIAVTIEAIAFFDGGAVGLLHKVVSSEGADEHQESALRQVEIGEQCVDCAKRIGLANENVRFAAPATKMRRILSRSGLEHANGGRSHSHHAAPSSPRCGDFRGSGLGQFAPLGMHLVVRNTRSGYRAKRANADMQSNSGRQHSTPLKMANQVALKMQTSGGRSY